MKVNINTLKENERNPRNITEAKMELLIDSILTFPKMLSLRPIVVDSSMTVLGGNMRTRALKRIANMDFDEVMARLEGHNDYEKKNDAEKKEIADHWAQWLNVRTVEIMKANELSDEEQQRFIIEDNASFGQWDWDMLANEWNSEDLNNWGVDVWNSEAEEESTESGVASEDDFDEEKDCIEVRCKKGDVWQLGEHRLMCGDSTKAESYDRLLQGDKAVLCFTDPPYGMKKEKDGVMNDNLNFADLLEFNKLWIPLTFANLTDNGSWYCWGIDEPLMDIYAFILKPMQDKGKLTYRNLLTWDKGNGQGQMSENYRMYALADEKCLFVMMGQQMYGRDKSTWFEGFEKFRLLFKDELKKAGLTTEQAIKLTGNSYLSHCTSQSQYGFPTKEIWNKMFEISNGKAFKQDYEKVKQDYEKVKQEWYATRAYFNNTHDNMNNVWHFDRTSKEERALTGGHATPKPLALCARGIKTSSRDADIVLDVFGGSGSTLIACEQLGRKGYLMELDPHYCDVIIARWEKLTGKKATRIETETE